MHKQMILIPKHTKSYQKTNQQMKVDVPGAIAICAYSLALKVARPHLMPMSGARYLFTCACHRLHDQAVTAVDFGALPHCFSLEQISHGSLRFHCEETVVDIQLVTSQ